MIDQNLDIFKFQVNVRTQKIFSFILNLQHLDLKVKMH